MLLIQQPTLWAGTGSGPGVVAHATVAWWQQLRAETVAWRNSCGVQLSDVRQSRWRGSAWISIGEATPWCRLRPGAGSADASPTVTPAALESRLRGLRRAVVGRAA